MIDFDLTPVELLFWNALALIAAACLFAPLFRRLGLGTILGYLAAGLAVQLVMSESLGEHPEELLHFAEFGVVLFLFVIGLELKPRVPPYRPIVHSAQAMGRPSRRNAMR